MPLLPVPAQMLGMYAVEMPSPPWSGTEAITVPLLHGPIGVGANCA